MDEKIGHFGRVAAKLIPIVGSLLRLRRDASDNREACFDSSIASAVRDAIEALKPSGGFFKEQYSKALKALFFGSNVSQTAYFEKLQQVENNDLTKVFLEYFYKPERSYMSDACPRVLAILNEVGDANEEIAKAFLHAVLGYLAIVIDLTPMGRDQILRGLLGEVSKALDDGKDPTNLLHGNIVLCLQENFKEALLTICASSFVNLDENYMCKALVSHWASPETSFANPEDKLTVVRNYLKENDYFSVTKGLKGLANELFLQRDTLALQDMPRAAKILNRCLVMMAVYKCDLLRVSPDNWFDYGKSRVAVCAHHEIDEIGFVLSCLADEILEYDRQIVALGAIGFAEEDVRAEAEAELASNIGGHNPDPFCLNIGEVSAACDCIDGWMSSTLTPPARPRSLGREKIQSELEQRAQYNSPEHFYLVLERESYGESLAQGIAKEYPCLRFVLRSDQDVALRLSDAPNYLDEIAIVQCDFERLA